MDFILFLIFAGVVFYFNQIKPRQNAQTTTEVEVERAPQQVLRPQSTQPAPPPRNSVVPSQRVGRPRMPPLHGIEISAAQCRRLGKNDPSVIAAQLNKQYSTGSGHTPSLFEQLKQLIEQTTQTTPERSHSTAPTASSLSKQLHKMFDDLFSEQRPR
jgi:hypothetical protein